MKRDMIVNSAPGVSFDHINRTQKQILREKWTVDHSDYYEQQQHTQRHTWICKGRRSEFINY